MKSISFKTITQKALAAFYRFPFAILFAIAAAVASMVWMHKTQSNYQYEEVSRLMEIRYAHYVMTFYVAMLLSISVAFFSERFRLPQVKTWLLYAAGIALCWLFYISLQGQSETMGTGRFVLYIIALHLLVSFSAFLVRNEMNGFWQFNKSLFLRYLLSALYSGVIYAGVALAILAVDKLFNAKIPGETYFDLWVFMAGVFNTWFFLAGVPEDAAALQERHDYPKGLKIFTVNVLLPLVTLYMVILYLYMFKIIITANWPVGWVTYLVIAFSVFGILSFLLVYPLREQENNRWINSYNRLFYFLILPLIGLLAVAIYKRVHMYGITENRYYILLLAMWLVFIAVYSIVTKSRNIRTIPLSLAVIAVLSSMGPWSAFNVSRNSQTKQLTDLLNENKMLADGKIDTAITHNVMTKDKERLESIILYMCEVHGYQTLQPFFTLDLSKLDNSKDSYSSYGYRMQQAIVEKLNIKEVADSGAVEETESKQKKLAVWGDNDWMVSSQGYDFSSHYYVRTGEVVFINGSNHVSIFFHQKEKYFEATMTGCSPIRLNADNLITQVEKARIKEIKDESFSLQGENSQWKVKLVFTNITIDEIDGTMNIERGSSFLLVGLKKP